MIEARDDDESPPNIGPCCVCEKGQDGTVRNLVMLPFEAPPGTVGWGCVQCGIGMRGATAVVCDACCEIHADDMEQAVRFIMGGEYPKDRVRVPLAGYEREPFKHRLELHPECSPPSDAGV